MSILTHGSDLSLAPTIRPLLRHADQTVRGAVELAATTGFRSIQLDATINGIRPRDLGTRARQDLVALLTRRGLRLAGVDLFIPRKHFLEPANLDRAITSTLAAIEMAADLGRVPLSIALPVAQVTDDVRSTLVAAADGHGITLAVHAEDHADALIEWVKAADVPALGAAIDPAAVIARGDNPVASVQKLGKLLKVGRLSDFQRETATRCVPGDGDLDLDQYCIMLDLATGRIGPIVLDLRNLEQAQQAAAQAIKAWDDAGFSV